MKRSKQIPICPTCGKVALEVASPFGPKHFCCNLWSYNFRPLVSKQVHQARSHAHRVFDSLWKHEKLMSRSEAYRELRWRLGLTAEQCHIGEIEDVDILNRIPQLTADIRSSFLVARVRDL